MEPTAKVNILLVDDNPAKLLALETILADLDQHLVKAASADEALRQLLRQDFAQQFSFSNLLFPVSLSKAAGVPP